MDADAENRLRSVMRGKFPGTDTRRTRDGKTISQPAPVSEIDAARVQAYAEFVSEPKPQVSDQAFNKTWMENIELRENLVLCQTELNKTYEWSRGVYRQYADKCREIEKIKLEAANQVYKAQEDAKRANAARADLYLSWVNARDRLKAALAKLPKKERKSVGPKPPVARAKPANPPKPDPLDLPIDEIEMTVRAYNCLRSIMNVKTLRDVVALTKVDLLLCPNLGKVTLKEIEEVLKLHGLELKK